MTEDLRVELRRLGRSLAKARARERDVAARVAEAVRRNPPRHEPGHIPETELAVLARVDRQTVRAWLGKRRPTR